MSMQQKINPCNRLILRQQGAALILMAFIIGLGSAAYLMKTMAAVSAKSNYEEKTNQALAEAKKALIDWAVSHPSHPGILPFPDRNDDPFQYDDKSDCVTAAVEGSHLIGRLPLLSDVNCVAPQQGVNIDGRDGGGEKLWYSVSINLVRMSDASATPIINPSIINSPAQPWFVVRDRNGAVISNRVAAVIFSSGTSHPNQDRSGSGADASEYLDRVTMADGTVYQNYGYQDISTNPVQEFILAENSQKLSNLDTTYQRPFYFNDKLVYITIDELMAALERRAAVEIENALLNYRDPASITRPNGRGLGYFPYAASLGSNKDYACKPLTASGVLPISSAAPSSFSCTYSRLGTPRVTNVSCTTGFSNLNSITFQRTTNNFNAASGSCKFNANVCTCTGPGSCSRIAGTIQTFTCDATGNCLTSATSGTLNGTVTFSGGEFTSATTRCAQSCTDAVCSGNGLGSASRSVCADQPFNSGGSALPAWVMENRWYDYFYYSSSRDAVTLTAGAKLNIDGLLISTGAPIITTPFATKGSAQTHSGCNLNDYLDTVENTNLNSVFEPTNRQKAVNYNDQIFVVAP